MLASIAAMLALSTSATLAESQVTRHTLSGSRVAIYNLAGTVRLEPGSGSNVEVTVSAEGRDARQLRVESRSIGGLPTLVVHYPDDDIVYPRNDRNERRSTESRIRDDGTWGSRDGESGRGWRDRMGLDRARRVRVRSTGSGTEAWADVVVRVPSGHAVDAYLLVGHLSADGVRGDLLLNGSAASVTAERVTGVVRVDAGSGSTILRDIRGSLLDVDVGSGGITLEKVRSDRCVLDTGSGSVTGTDVSCTELSADAGSGGVRLSRTTATTVDVDVGSGGITLDLASAPRTVTLESGSGGVTLTLPAKTGATIDIETGSGGIHTDFPISTRRVERNSLRGTIGDGAARISIETGSGAVRLNRRP